MDFERNRIELEKSIANIGLDDPWRGQLEHSQQQVRPIYNQDKKPHKYLTQVHNTFKVKIMNGFSLAGDFQEEFLFLCVLRLFLLLCVISYQLF